MPVELILRAENKADAIKTEQQYIEQQVRFFCTNLNVLTKYIQLNFILYDNVSN